MITKKTLEIYKEEINKGKKKKMSEDEKLGDLFHITVLWFSVYLRWPKNCIIAWCLYRRQVDDNVCHLLPPMT